MKILTWLLTKTMIPRAIAMAIAGAFVAWGLIGGEPIKREMWDTNGNKVIVEETPKNIVGEALTLVIVGGLSLLIEQKKTSDTKKTQEILKEHAPADQVENFKVDGWSGPKTQKAVKEVSKEASKEDARPEPYVTAAKVASNPNRKG